MIRRSFLKLAAMAVLVPALDWTRKLPVHEVLRDEGVELFGGAVMDSYQGHMTATEVQAICAEMDRTAVRWQNRYIRVTEGFYRRMRALQ